MSESFEHLPPDLQDLAEALIAHRDEADGHLLERVERRVQSSRRRGVPRRFPLRRPRSTAAIVAMLLALNASAGLAVACGTGYVSIPSVPSIFSTIWHWCNPPSPPPPPVTVYCPPQGVHYSGYNTVTANNGTQSCCPQGDTPFPITGTTDHQPNTICCPKDTSPNASKTACCPSSQTSWYSGDGKSSGCCPSGTSPTGTNHVCCPPNQTGYMSSDGKTSGCCPSGESPSGANNVCCPQQHTGWMSSDGKTSGCCPSGDSPSGANNVCCPQQQTGWMSSDGKTSGCCPNGYNPSGTNHFCCPNGQTSYLQYDGKTSGCCPNGTSPSGSNNVCCPSQQTGWMTSDGKTSGCCPNGTDHTGTNNVCCPKQSSGYGYNTSGSSIPKGCCPSSNKISFRWHYSGNTSGSSWSSGSWSSTQSNWYGSSWSWGGSMEGALKVNSGSTLKVGYDLSVPGNTSPVAFTVNSPTIVFSVACVSGKPTATTFTATLPSQGYAFSGSSWYPNSSQSDSSVYQGSVSVPNLCHGGQLLLSSGGTFNTSVS